METKVRFTNSKQYCEFKKDAEDLRNVWEGVNIRFEDDDQIAVFENMSEEGVMTEGICLKSMFLEDEISVVKE